MGLSSGFRSTAAAFGCGRPGDFEDPAEIFPAIWKFGNFWKFGNLAGRAIYTPVAKMGLSSGFRSTAAASGCGRPGDFEDPAEIFPVIWKFGNLERKGGNSPHITVSSGGVQGLRGWQLVKNLV